MKNNISLNLTESVVILGIMSRTHIQKYLDFCLV